MKTLVILMLSILIAGCSDVEFSQTEEALRGRLNQNDIQINFGDVYTRQKPVILSIVGEEDQEMYVTNDPTCRTGGVWEPYQAQKSWELVKLNQNSFVYVKFKDSRGTVSDCLFDDILHDNIPPTLNFTHRPRSFNNLKNLDVGLVAKDSLSGVAESYCAIDDNPEYIKCKDVLKIKNLKEGLHNIRFVATDKAGNRSEPLVLSWHTDLTPPLVTFSKKPPGLSNLESFEIGYLGYDEMSGIAGYNCKVNNGKYQSCKEQSILKGLKSGRHQFTVMAIDKAGNYSAPVSHWWDVDLDKPTVRITKAPGLFTRDLSATFEFVAMDGDQKLNYFECQLKGLLKNITANPNWFPCRAITSINDLAGGVQELKVRTRDLAGNYSDPAIHTWTIDLVPPVVDFNKTPANYSNQTQADLQWRGLDRESGIQGYRCWLDSRELACGDKISLHSLSEGLRVFEVQTVDRVGNVSEKIKYSWRIDLTPPTLSFLKVPDDFISSKSAVFSYTGKDDFSQSVSYECQHNDGPFRPCGEKFEALNLAEGKQTFMVRAYDEAGNVSSPLSHQWVVDLSPPTVQLLERAQNHLNTLPSKFSIVVTDNLSGVDQVWCGIKGQLTTCNVRQVKTFILDPGNYEFEVIAIDRVGNRNLVSHNWTVLDKFRPVSKDIAIDQNSYNVDILFVIDNSDSMAPYQRNMAQRIDNFIAKIDGLNWQIAVTSTDPRTEASDPFCDNFGSFGCDIYPIEHGDGGFAKFETGDYILTSSIEAVTAQHYLGRAIQMGTGGSSSEEGIRATYRALEKSLDRRFPYHQQFVRSASSLAVVLISDEDENNNKFKNKPENLYQFFQDTWGASKSFQFHSIIDMPQFNCPNNFLGFGKSYAKMSDLTGGIVGSICQPNYSQDLATIGQEVLEQVSSVDLDCEPEDKNGDGHPDIEVDLEMGGGVPSYTVEGKKLTFIKPLPVGRHRVHYLCLRE